MLQSFLVDRFKLSFHRETQQLPVYELIRAGGNTKLQQTKEGSCTVYGPVEVIVIDHMERPSQN